MKQENKAALENLSKTCYNGGLLPIFLGILVTFIDVVRSDLPHALTGMFIFVTGYSFVKISKKLKIIVESE